jgi:hypothetical protein
MGQPAKRSRPRPNQITVNMDVLTRVRLERCLAYKRKKLSDPLYSITGLIHTLIDEYDQKISKKNKNNSTN